jgi:predicted ArsR family transcriptional regulator
MTDQLALTYDDRMAGNYRNSDPVSSVVAGRSCNAEAQRGRILALLNDRGPMYAAQIASVLDIPTGQVSTRLAAMANRGLVRRLDEMGENESGHPVLVWESLASTARSE